MLIEFRTENHRSIRDEQVITMAAAGVGANGSKQPKAQGTQPDGILPVAAIYGANASGKSNVLSALAFMRYAVMDSHRFWEAVDHVPRDAFAWGPKQGEPSMFEVIVLIDSVRYQYGFVADSNRILEEWLYAWPHGKKQTWFERDSDDYKFGNNLKGENKVIVEVTRSNALFLSSAVQHRHQQLRKLSQWFGDQTLLIPLQTSSTSQASFRLRHTGPLLAPFGRGNTPRKLSSVSEDAPEHLMTSFLTMVRTADVGIEDIRFVRQVSSDGFAGSPEKRIQLKHMSPFGEAWLPLEAESNGTQKLFQMAWPVIQTLQQGGILVVDELESSLHPALGQAIVNLFNDPNSNPFNAQLIFTTHDTNLLSPLLGQPALRRDQVWFTEKDNEGGTTLYPLSDYKPRKAENIERGYLQGRYGAIPFLGNFSWGDEEGGP